MDGKKIFKFLKDYSDGFVGFAILIWLVRIVDTAGAVADTTNLLGQVTKFIYEHWWAKLLSLFIGVGLIVWNIERRAAAKFVTAEALKGIARADRVELLERRLEPIERRMLPVDNLATAYFLEFQYPKFKEALGHLEEAWAFACASLLKADEFKGETKMRLRMAKQGYERAFEKVREQVRGLRRELSNDEPPASKLVPQGAENYPDVAKDAYRELWVMHELNRFRIAQLEATINADLRMRTARITIEDFARSLE
jgi:hypothetical protein